MEKENKGVKIVALEHDAERAIRARLRKQTRQRKEQEYVERVYRNKHKKGGQ